MRAGLARFLSVVVIVLFAPLVSRAESRWLDQSHAPFFPKSAGSIVDVQGQFPLLWWDVLVVETNNKDAPNWEEIQEDCGAFAKANEGRISKIFCGANLNDLVRQASIFEEWAHDFPLRHERPPESELRAEIDSVLAQASLPIGPLVQLLRKDPYRSLPELQKLATTSLSFKLEQRGGFFFDAKSNRVLIPVQFGFPASETSKMREVSASLSQFCLHGRECLPAAFVGAHAATLENESRVKSDLQAVSEVSAVLLVIVLVFICVTKRWRLLLIIPPIFIAIGLALVATIGVFGKVHGLTLAFGPGIVGLAMDYGLHIAFSNQPERIWRANLFGLLTTVVVLFVMMLSQIPLLQQLMFFSAVGVVLGSLVIYLIYRKYPSAFQVRSYGVPIPRSPVFSWIVLFLVGCSVVGLAFASLSLDMRSLGYQSPKTAELNQWMYTSVGAQSPLLQVSSGAEPGQALLQAHEQKTWAADQGLKLSNVASFLPTVEKQRANVKSWPEYQCGDAARVSESKWFVQLAKVQQQFFRPYFAEVPCNSLQPKQLVSVSEAPSYLKDFGYEKEWLTLWFPQDDAQIAKIKSRYPGVLSYVDLAMVFPKVFAHELIWMVPVALALAFLILVYYYRRFSLACLAVTPFFSALGLYLLMNFIFGWSMSFISVIGLIMVFGFSLDFGVFAVDLMRRPKDRPDDGIWTALTVAAVINGCGFIPLLFCYHPVLAHLGRTLVFGTIGTFVGSLWGVPGLYQWTRRRTEDA